MFVKQEVEKVFDHFLDLDSPYDSGLNILTDSSSSSPTSPASSFSSAPASPTKLNPSITNGAPLIEEGSAPKKHKTSRKRKQSEASTENPKDHGNVDYLDLKKAKRRNQNRIAAQNSREKKKRYLQDLQNKLRVYMEQNEALLERVKNLEAENKVLCERTPQANHSHPTNFYHPTQVTNTVRNELPELPLLETPIVKKEVERESDNIIAPVIAPFATSDESAELQTQPQQSDVAKNNLLAIMMSLILPFLFLQVVSQVANLWASLPKYPQNFPSTTASSSTSQRSMAQDLSRAKISSSNSSTRSPMMSIPFSEQHSKDPCQTYPSQVSTFLQLIIFHHHVKSCTHTAPG